MVFRRANRRIRVRVVIGFAQSNETQSEQQNERQERHCGLTALPYNNTMTDSAIIAFGGATIYQSLIARVLTGLFNVDRLTEGKPRPSFGKKYISKHRQFSLYIGKIRSSPKGVRK